jgi:hypothetical protein
VVIGLGQRRAVWGKFVTATKVPRAISACPGGESSDRAVSCHVTLGSLDERLRSGGAEDQREAKV